MEEKQEFIKHLNDTEDKETIENKIFLITPTSEKTKTLTFRSNSVKLKKEYPLFVKGDNQMENFILSHGNREFLKSKSQSKLQANILDIDKQKEYKQKCLNLNINKNKNIHFLSNSSLLKILKNQDKFEQKDIFDKNDDKNNYNNNKNNNDNFFPFKTYDQDSFNISSMKTRASSFIKRNSIYKNQNRKRNFEIKNKGIHQFLSAKKDQNFSFNKNTLPEEIKSDLTNDNFNNQQEKYQMDCLDQNDQNKCLNNFDLSDQPSNFIKSGSQDIKINLRREIEKLREKELLVNKDNMLKQFNKKEYYR